MSFAATYLCKTCFSTLVHVKDKTRNYLDASDDMSVPEQIQENEKEGVHRLCDLYMASHSVSML